MAYHHPADVVGYGGAGGGGKTDLALGLALTQHKKSLLLRRELTNTRSMFDRAREILGDRVGRFNESQSTWKCQETSQKIEFAGCSNPGDEQKYRGRPHDFIAFDEADQFPENVVRFICGWLRTTVHQQRCRVLLNFNPPATADGEWLLEYFGPWVDDKHPRPAKPGDLRWYAMVDGKEVERENSSPFTHKCELIRPKSRTFIPARLLDNPYLMATGYGPTLQALPEPLRSQVLYGDFSIGRQDDAWQVIPTAWIRAAQARWTPQPPPHIRLSAIGVDVARGGDDKTVLAPRYGTWFGPLQKYPGNATPDGPRVVGLIQLALQPNPHALVCIDVIGVGSSVVDGCRLAKVPYIMPVNFAEKTLTRDRAGLLEFANLRAFAYWALRDLLDPASKQPPLALPPDRELLADLAAGRWAMTLQGVKMESKEDIKKRIGRSPDCGDALACSILVPPPRPPTGPIILRA